MKPIEEYADLFERLGLTELYVEEDGCRLRLKKDTKPATAPVLVGGFPGAAAATPDIAAKLAETVVAKPVKEEVPAEKPAETKAVPAGDTVKAPLLGIFHPSAGGTERTVGDRVRKGEAICTIEAMKMMNEVAAPRDGVIRAILPKDGALVEFDQDLVVLM